MLTGRPLEPSLNETGVTKVKNLKRRSWVSVVVGFVLVSTTLAAIPFWGSAANAASAADKILYVQTTGASGTYIQYVPGDGSTPTNESVTGGGGCATPSPSGIPLLQLSASYYASGFSGLATPAVVGAYKARTGVCKISPAWGIEQFEALKFSVGTNALVKGRLFTSATIDLTGNCKSSIVTQGRLVETLAGKVVGQQTFSSTNSEGTVFVVSTGNIASGFDQIEIQTLSPSNGSISVAGTGTTFTLGGPHVTLTKTHVLKNADGSISSSPNFTTAGQVVTYTITATNDGYEALSNVTVTDVPTPDGGFSCSPTGSTLAAGASIVCTGTHTVTQADVDTGALSDLATVNATGTAGQSVTASASDSLTATQNPQITLTKTDNLHTYSAPGQVVTYTITATNTGNVTLSNVQVSDSPSLDGFTCAAPVATLPPGGVISCTGSHTITLDDFSGAGTYANSATVSGTGPQGQIVSSAAADSVSAQVHTLCPGDTITTTAAGTATSGDVTGQLTLTSGSCKTYTYFQASTNDFTTSPDDGKSIIFDSQSVSADRISATFDWGLVPACRPDSGGSGSTLPTCPPTKISFDGGVTFQAQTYCDPASPPASPAWCTTGKSFTDVVVDGTTYTHITETWLGTGDPRISK